jgi:hypothetical protein
MVMEGATHHGVQLVQAGKRLRGVRSRGRKGKAFNDLDEVCVNLVEALHAVTEPLLRLRQSGLLCLVHADGE